MSKFELRVDNLIREELKKSKVEFGEQHDLPKSIKDALDKASKSGTGFGKPDFVITFKDYPDTCVVIEDKYGLEFLKNETKQGLSESQKAVMDFALNGAVHYAKSILDNDNAAFPYNSIY